MQKVVLKCAIEDEKSKREAMRIVAVLPGVESIAVDMKKRKITVIGEVDPVCLTTQLRKFGFSAELLSVGPVEEEMKIGEKGARGVHIKPPAIENKRGSNQYLGVQNMGLNRGTEDEGSEKRIKEAVEGFGDFISVEVNVKQGMVTVVGDLDPVSLAIQIRKLGYRAKLLNVVKAIKAKEGNPVSFIYGGNYPSINPPESGLGSDSTCCIV